MGLSWAWTLYPLSLPKLEELGYDTSQPRFSQPRNGRDTTEARCVDSLVGGRSRCDTRIGVGVLWKVILIYVFIQSSLSTCYVPDMFLGPGAPGETSIVKGSPSPASVGSLDCRGSG